MAVVTANSNKRMPPARVSPAASRARTRDFRPCLALVRMGQVLYTWSSEKLPHRQTNTKGSTMRLSQRAMLKIPLYPLA